MNSSEATLLHRGLTGETVLSPDLKYRYCLWRRWGDSNGSYALFVGLNPSTADATIDDPTIRRCKGFSQKWGLTALCMVNLFAFRSTDPNKLYQVQDPVGPLNDRFIITLAKGAGRVVAAWGTRGTFMQRDQAVTAMLNSVTCLGRTKDGCPKHPLYVPYATKLTRYA